MIFEVYFEENLQQILLGSIKVLYNTIHPDKIQNYIKQNDKK